jgi:hypothetical protein
MTLTDTGALVALADIRDPYHARCTACLPRLSAPFVTTLPCFTESLHLVGKSGGYQAQTVLWRYRTEGVLSIHPMTNPEIDRAAAFMDTYRDAPCDFADASLLTAAETLGLRRVFTLDGHFYAYRLASGETLEVVPGPAR